MYPTTQSAFERSNRADSILITALFYQFNGKGMTECYLTAVRFFLTAPQMRSC